MKDLQIRTIDVKNINSILTEAGFTGTFTREVIYTILTRTTPSKGKGPIVKAYFKAVYSEKYYSNLNDKLVKQFKKEELTAA